MPLRRAALAHGTVLGGRLRPERVAGARPRQPGVFETQRPPVSCHDIHASRFNECPTQRPGAPRGREAPRARGQPGPGPGPIPPLPRPAPPPPRCPAAEGASAAAWLLPSSSGAGKAPQPAPLPAPPPPAPGLSLFRPVGWKSPVILLPGSKRWGVEESVQNAGHVRAG